MVFHWSTPERRIGDIELEPIPIEIYHDIFRYIGPSAEFSDADCRTTFSSIAGVCRFFAAEALPRVFHSFQIACNSPESRTAMKLCIDIKNDKLLASHIATLVRECILSGWVFDEENKTEEAALAAMLSLVRKAIQKMPDLESIKLENCSISSAMVKLVRQAVGLRSLHLHECRLSSLVEAKLWDKLSSARIVDLTLIHSQYDTLEIVIVPHLSFPHLNSLKTNHRGLLGAVSVTANHLQRLIITNYTYLGEDLVHLGTALGRLPLLTHLSINRLTKDCSLPSNLMPIDFTKVSLPSLRSLLCPGNIAANFLSPAPETLVHLDLTGEHNLSGVPIHFPFRMPDVHVASIEELVLPTQRIIKGGFPFNHPHPLLRKLTIVGKELGNRNFELCCKILRAVCAAATPKANIPPLVEISFASATNVKWILDLPSQHDEIQRLSPFFPALREVRLEECVCWELQADGWEPTILQPKKMRLLMAEFPEERKDYRGCFGRYC